LKDGQDAGEMLLDIEARIGRMLPLREKAFKTAYPSVNREKGNGLPRDTQRGDGGQFRFVTLRELTRTVPCRSLPGETNERPRRVRKVTPPNCERFSLTNCSFFNKFSGQN